jgi:hypothetical protein
MVALALIAGAIGLVAFVTGSVLVVQGLRELLRELRRHRGGADVDTVEFPPVVAAPRRRSIR